MQKLHAEILTKEQSELLYLIGCFKNNFGLVGGTAIALYIGHRRSIDFDLFSTEEFDNFKIRKKIKTYNKKIDRVIRDEEGDYSIILNNVRITFFNYPFKIFFQNKLNEYFNLPNLLTLAAMKAYALGRRAKWKDYVDLYFIIKKYYGIEPIIKQAKRIFAKEFNEKIFRAQLSYFKDIDYSERVIYLKGIKVNDEMVKKELVEFSLG